MATRTSADSRRRTATGPEGPASPDEVYRWFRFIEHRVVNSVHFRVTIELSVHATAASIVLHWLRLPTSAAHEALTELTLPQAWFDSAAAPGFGYFVST